MIASVALLYDFTLVTHNLANFHRIPGLRLADWLTP
jgi:predicted nucleic acid-binding protein